MDFANAVHRRPELSTTKTKTRTTKVFCCDWRLSNTCSHLTLLTRRVSSWCHVEEKPGTTFHRFQWERRKEKLRRKTFGKTFFFLVRFFPESGISVSWSGLWGHIVLLYAYRNLAQIMCPNWLVTALAWTLGLTLGYKWGSLTERVNSSTVPPLDSSHLAWTPITAQCLLPIYAVSDEV